MAETSVSDFASVINQQISLREGLTVCFAKLETLIVLGRNSNLSELKLHTANEYFWVLGDYVSQAIKCNDDALDCLLRKTNL
jgi:hypothetical protein